MFGGGPQSSPRQETLKATGCTKAQIHTMDSCDLRSSPVAKFQELFYKQHKNECGKPCLD